MSLTRWFFRWVQDEELIQRLESQTVSARLGAPLKYPSYGAFLINQPGVLVVGFHPQFWKLERKTWYRRPIRDAIFYIGGRKPHPLTHMTLMVWSNDEWLFPKDLSRAKVRVRTAEEALNEAETVWHWIAHIVSLPVKPQRARFNMEEFAEWERRTRGSRSLPTLPRRRSP